METHKEQELFMKVSSGNVFLLSSQFYLRLINMVCFSKEKRYRISILISLLIILGKILKHNFPKDGGGGEGEPCTSIVIQETGCGVKPNRMAVYGESMVGSVFSTFC